MMRVLVLGGGGFVGQRIVAALSASGRVTPVVAMRRAEGPDVMGFDALNPEALAKALDGIDGVVNCVTGSPETIRRGAMALAQVAGTRRVVHLSSMAVYGSATGPVDETAPMKPDIGAYGAAKIEAESLLSSANAVMLRPGCVHGPGGRLWTGRVAQLLASGRIGDLGRAGAGHSNLIDVEDLASAVLASLFLPAPGAFNLALPDAPLWNDYFARFAKALGVPCPRIPAWRLMAEGWLLAVPFKLAEKAGLNLPPPIALSQLRLWRQDIRMEMAAAEAQLGMAWTPLAKTLERSAEWVRSALREGSAPSTEHQGE